jgi:hypothetical protein
MRFCSDCKHSWLGEQMGAVGLYCRRYPPHVMLVPARPGEVRIASVHPAVDKNETCGEFHHAQATEVPS